MKALMTYGLAGLLTLGMSGTAFAYTIGDTDVGLEDTIVNVEGSVAELPNSGDATETLWVNTILGTDLVLDIKTETLTATAVDEDPDIYAAALAAGDLYFVIKNSTYWALFANVEDLMWAVFDTSQVVTAIEYEVLKDAEGNDYLNPIGEVTDTFAALFFNVKPDGTLADPLEISHISEFDGGNVPEPSTLALLGLGLLGIGFARRRSRC